MRLTKQDYWDIVRVIRSMEKGKTRRLMWAVALARLFAKSNSRFNKDMFIQACGAEDEELDNVVEFADRLRE